MKALLTAIGIGLLAFVFLIAWTCCRVAGWADAREKELWEEKLRDEHLKNQDK